MSTPPKEPKATPACMACLDGVCRDHDAEGRRRVRKSDLTRLSEIIGWVGELKPYEEMTPEERAEAARRLAETMK